MRDLLAAGLFRLKKSRLFWALTALSCFLGTWITLTRARERAQWAEAGLPAGFPMDLTFFAYILVGGVLAAVFVPLFFGTEHSDGALRNKLIVGSSRPAVYLSSLLLSMGVMGVVCAAYILPAFALGKLLLDPMGLPVPTFLALLAGTAPLALSLCGIFTLIALLCTKKATAATLSILLIFVLLMSGLIAHERITAPEYTPSFTLTVDGEIQELYDKNPAYLTGAKRTAWELFYDINPGGQAVQYYTRAPLHPGRLPLFSLGTLALVTGAGLAVFWKKDLK